MSMSAGQRDFQRSCQVQERLHQLVPGGAHTYSRGSDQYPENMAPVLVRGSGARVWDVDGNEYVEYGMGLRAVTLGHAYEPVSAAVRAALAEGTNFSRPTVVELAAAEDFLALVPGADMVKFGKNGSDATTAAVRLARAATGRDLVAICVDQPFFSVDDWFVATLPMNAGVPAPFGALTVGFRYNDLDSVRALFDEHEGRIAAVVLEAATTLVEPTPDFLPGLRALCDRSGTVLVFDEMITGFRWSEHGAQHVYGVVPDLSCWGKAMGNGFPISALAGKREIMELGGLNTDAHRVFTLSTTHGPETIGLTAFRAVAAAYRDGDPIGVMERRGRELASTVNDLAAELGLVDRVSALGRPSCLVFTSKDSLGVASQEYRTLLLGELLRHGVLGQSLVISAAHTEQDLDRTATAMRAAMSVYRRALDAGSTRDFLSGRPVAPALRSSAEPRRL
jgi:glutamate-1-semialdehyde 2,1-aminomutase